jgi:hypothetical protein
MTAPSYLLEPRVLPLARVSHNKQFIFNKEYYMNEVTLEVPLALQQLIQTNNQLLRKYQMELLQQIQESNTQMMQILRLSGEAGWKLDMERMVYVRPKTDEEIATPVEELTETTEQ